jgi:hypothetical protein
MDRLDEAREEETQIIERIQEKTDLLKRDRSVLEDVPSFLALQGQQK